MPKYSIGDIVKYKKQHHLILDVLEPTKFEPHWQYHWIILETGKIDYCLNVGPDIVGKRKA